MGLIPLLKKLIPFLLVVFLGTIFLVVLDCALGINGRGLEMTIHDFYLFFLGGCVCFSLFWIWIKR